MTTFDSELDRQLAELRRLVAGLNGKPPELDPRTFAEIAVAMSRVREALVEIAPAMEEAAEAVAAFGAELLEKVAEAIDPVMAELFATMAEFLEAIRRQELAARLAPWIGWRLADWMAALWPKRFLPKLPAGFLADLQDLAPSRRAMAEIKFELGETLAPDPEAD
jgi:hypothetical protein